MAEMMCAPTGKVEQTSCKICARLQPTSGTRWGPSTFSRLDGGAWELSRTGSSNHGIHTKTNGSVYVWPLTPYFIATTSINDFWFLGAKEEKWLHLCCDPAVILAISKASQSHHFFSVQVWIWFSQYVPLLALIYIWIADFTNDRNH